MTRVNHVCHIDPGFSPDRSPISRRIRRIGPLRMAKRRVYPTRRVSRKSHPREAREDADRSLTNNKPSAIYRLRPHLPSNIPQGQSAPATLGIEIAPISQLEELHARITGGADGAGTSGTSGKEVVQKVEVGKVAEKVVKNVSFLLREIHPARYCSHGIGQDGRGECTWSVWSAHPQSHRFRQSLHNKWMGRRVKMSIT